MRAEAMTDLNGYPVLMLFVSADGSMSMFGLTRHASRPGSMD